MKRSERPELPAYNPQFQPVVPVMNTQRSTASGTSSNRASPSFQNQISSSSTSSMHSHDSILCDQEDGSVARTRGIRHCRTETDLMRGLSRETSTDSGGVFLTPTSAGPSGATSRFEIAPRNRRSTPPNLAEIGRMLLSKDDGALVVEQQAPITFEFASRRLSSQFEGATTNGGSVGDLDHDLDRVSHVRSNSVRGSGGGSRRNLAPPTLTTDLPLLPNPNRTSGNHHSRALFTSGAIKQSKGKKEKKKSAGNEELNDGASNKSYKVHGGNPKWAWKK